MNQELTDRLAELQAVAGQLRELIAGSTTWPALLLARLVLDAEGFASILEKHLRAFQDALASTTT